MVVRLHPGDGTQRLQFYALQDSVGWDFFFANPLGFLVLSGIGGIILIHFLRRKSRRIVVSTLFLCSARPSIQRRRKALSGLRNSLPLWVQVLVVVALAWLAAQPRWIDSTSVQTVVAVFDSSGFDERISREDLAGRRQRAETK